MSKEPESSSKSDSIPNTSISTYHTASLCRRWSRNGFSTGMKRLQNPYNLPVTIFFFIFAWSIIVVVSFCQLQILCKRAQREFTLSLPSAAKYFANTLQTSAKRVLLSICRVQLSIMQILCKRAQREFTLSLPSAAKYYANIAIKPCFAYF